MYNLTMTIEKLNKHIELISLPHKKILEVFQNVYKPFEELSEILGHQVYVDPTTFETLVSVFPIAKSRKVSIEEITANPDIYFIYTNHVKLPRYRDSYIIVDKQTAFLINKLDMTFRQKFYLGIKKVPFNKNTSVLTVEDYHFEIDKDSDTYNLCLMLFGSKQYINRIWKWNDILDKVMGHSDERNDDVNAFRLKVYRLNLRLYKTGYKNIILYKNKTVRVNPDYIFLFK